MNALRAGGQIEPSPDLWSRVVHSIEEDRAHRRRVVISFVTVTAIVAALVGIGMLNVIDTPAGRQVRIPAMELIETIALVSLVVVLGPAIRRFGRGYAHDLWRTTPDLPTSLLRLLDVAYLLVFGGYILMTSYFDFGRSRVVVAEQIEELLQRVGGLLLTMGLLHAATIMALPLIALVSNSTRVGRKLPRWVVAILVLVGLGVGFFGLQALIGGIASSA
ncbi:MAG TPA: hypothetical protein VMY16_06600 [Ilumatobacteraceae bacterium]|nr:hypothetical protein [Ilumatobacteraceae bacterium]